MRYILFITIFISQLNMSMALPTKNLENKKDTRAIKVNNDYLISHPDLFDKFIFIGIQQNNITMLKRILVDYPKSKKFKPYLYKKAKASILTADGKTKEAIKIYRKILATTPEDNQSRFNLAQLLLKNRRFDAAIYQFKKLKKDKNITYKDKKAINSYLIYIGKERGVKIDFSINYIFNDNINSATTHKYKNSGWSSEKPKTSIGISYALSLKKNFFINATNTIIAKFNVSGKSYFIGNNSQYDNLFSRTYLGWKYQKNKHNFSIIPFYQYQMSGTEPWGSGKQKKPTKNYTLIMSTYSTAPGISLDYSYNLKPNLGLGLNFDVYKSKTRVKIYSDTRNGLNISTSSYLSYWANKENQFYFSINSRVFKPEKRKLDNGEINYSAYNGFGIGISWQKQWGFLLGTKTNIYLQGNIRNYAGKSLDPDTFKSIERKDKGISTNITIWNPQINIFNFTPKLKFSFYKNNSSIAWATTKNKSFNVFFDKSF